MYTVNQFDPALDGPEALICARQLEPAAAHGAPVAWLQQHERGITDRVRGRPAFEGGPGCRRNGQRGRGARGRLRPGVVCGLQGARREAPETDQLIADVHGAQAVGVITDKEAVRGVNARGAQHEANAGELARIGLTHIHRIVRVAGEHTHRMPPARVQQKRRVAAYPQRGRGIRVLLVHLRGPLARSEHEAGPPEAAMQDLEQGTQQDHVPDPAEPDDDRLHGGCRHDSSPQWEAHKLVGSGRPWQRSPKPQLAAFALSLGLMALALAAIAVFSYPAWTLLHPYFDFPFHRVGERIGMLALLAGFLLVARHLRLADRASLG